MPPIEILVLGAGNRGTHAYGPYAIKHPEDVSFVAVAEPDKTRRDHFGDTHEIAPEMRFASWEEALARPKLAQAIINTTMDRTHYHSTIAALKAGYDVLLEKPMATTLDECRGLVRAAEENGRLLQICHVLRYTNFFNTLREIVQSGRLGNIITIDHRENVSFWHMSHSFVRGNWRNEAESAPMILAKCCHDMDALVWTLGQQVSRLNSFGRLTHYRSENAPEGAPKRCTDGCPVADSCLWYAPKLYRARPGDSNQGSFMINAMGGGDTPEARFEKLKTSPYGRCVYHCDNDVVDHQVITMDFAGGTTCTFTMQGHSDMEGRSMRWDGTKATLYGDFFDQEEIRIRDHGSDKFEVIKLQGGAGHGGGDEGIMRDFANAMRGKSSPHQTTARVSLESHLMCFAAEDARHTNTVVSLDDYRAAL